MGWGGRVPPPDSGPEDQSAPQPVSFSAAPCRLIALLIHTSDGRRADEGLEREEGFCVCVCVCAQYHVCGLGYM